MLVWIILSVACGLYAYWQLTQRKAITKEPPACTGALPIIGHIHLLIGSSEHLWNTMKNFGYESIKRGGAVSMHIGPMRKTYVLTDPDDCMTVANTCLNKDYIYSFAKGWLGNGLVTAPLSIWKNHRKLLNPSFSQQLLDGFMGVFNDQSRRLVENIAVEVDKKSFDCWPYLGHNSLETICLTAMGIDIRDKSNIDLNDQYVKTTEELYNVLISRFQKFWLHNDFLYSFTEHKKKEDELVKILQNMSYAVLQRKKKIKENGIVNNNYNAGGKFKAFIDLLLDQANVKQAFTDTEIREEVDTIIVAGHETSASALMYAIILLGSHPEVQDKLHKEIQEVFEKSDRDVEKQDLSKLIYMEAVLKESLRLYTLAPIVARTVDQEVKLKNYTLLPGNSCFLFYYCMHRLPIWGVDAEMFRPERWLEPSSLPDNPAAFGAFSLGRRMCIGKTYSLMSMKVTLVHFLRHYRVSADYTRLTFKIDIFLKPIIGHHISIQKRFNNLHRINA